MTEIKPDAQGSNQNNQQEKTKPNIKAAIRLAQKQEQQIIKDLQNLRKREAFQPIQYDQQKTQLQKYLDLPFESRNKKIYKSIKAQLSYLPCFQVHAQTDMPKELLAIMKRDIDMLISVISKFVYPVLYPKGSIIQTVSSTRKSVKVLLRGEALVFEPINYKSYKNCSKNAKQSKIKTEWLDNIIKKVNYNPQPFNQEKANKNQALETYFNPEDFQAEISFHLKCKHKRLSQEICKKIMMNSGIITPTTPHRQTMYINQPGHLICSERRPYVVNQTKGLEHTTICLTETYVLQLEYDIYKAAIAHLNSDEQKKYIQALLKKFEMFEYFDAKQYVKKQYMLDRKREEQEQKKRQQQQNNRKYGLDQQQILITRHTQPIQKIVKQDGQSQPSQTKSQKGKVFEAEQVDIETYEIKYDSDIYLIVSGQVTIIIDIIGQTRLSNFQHASKVRSFQSHQLLKLYSSDIFGFEQIGKVKQYKLRYRVNKNSKLLLLSQNIYVGHFSQIPGFRTYFKSLQNQRNQLISSMLKKIEDKIQKQQIKRFQSLSSLQLKEQKTPSNSMKTERLLPYNSQSLIKRVQFVGKSQFQAIENKIIDKLAKQKESQANNMSFKQMIKTGKQLKDSLSFASIYQSHLPKNCEIVGNYVEVRNKNGILKRKKHIIEENSNHNEKQKQIFRKLGIISDEDRNNHNFQLISNRKSKYVLEDFQKQSKQMNRLRHISRSLPKLNFFYAKKQQVLYNNIHKRDY